MQESEDESNSDFTMDFSFNSSDSDAQDCGHLTSTPTKLDVTTTLDFDASSPVSFLGPTNFSLADDSTDVSSVSESIDESICIQSSSNFTSQSQDNSSTLIQPHQISNHCSQSDTNARTPNNRPHPTNSNQLADTSEKISIGSKTSANFNPTTSSQPCTRGIKIVGDNVDKTVKTRYMRVDQQGRSLHYFHAYAAQDRFDLTMPEEAPKIPDDPDLDKLLPSDCDNSTMKKLFAIHVARIICKHMPFFSEDFGDVIPENLEHPMSYEMRQKSQVVSLSHFF